MAKSKSLTKAVDKEIKSKFSLSSFKEKKGLGGSVKFKQQKWLELSPAIKNTLNIPGIPLGHITLLRGRSDTGKTTLLLEAAIEAQKVGILPVFIITEMKWDFAHAKKMGFEVDIIDDPEKPGELDYKGFFIYADRSTLHTIEDISAFIIDLMDEQSNGNLPYDLLFLWDSSGSIPCRQSVEKSNNNPQWNAGAMATQFGNFVNQKFSMSRKVTSPYTNTLVTINKVGIQPAATAFSMPRMTNKGGDTLFWDATLVITFGNVTNSGTSKLTAQKDGKKVEFAKRTKVAVDKLHLGEGVSTSGVLIVTPHGFLENKPTLLTEYKKNHSSEWFDNDDSEIIYGEDSNEWEESAASNPFGDMDEN